MSAAARQRGSAAVVAVGVLVVLFAMGVIAVRLARPEPPAFAPSPVEPRPEAVGLVGPEVYTVDATAPDRWRFFSFARGSVLEDPGPLEWDLAFRRFQILANGGAGFAGRGGILDLGEVPFDSVRSVPVVRYEETRAARDSVNPAVEDWYTYSFVSHLLSPRPRVYAVRTADARYAKMEILGYYCPGAVPGCLTFRYVFQGGGGPHLAFPDPD
jgi:hypothetical protein